MKSFSNYNFNFFKLELIDYQKQHQRCSLKKTFVNISQNSQENTCARVFLINFLKKETLAQMFPMNFDNFLGTPFYSTKPGHCFWTITVSNFQLSTLVNIFVHYLTTYQRHKNRDFSYTSQFLVNFLAALVSLISMGLLIQRHCQLLMLVIHRFHLLVKRLLVALPADHDFFLFTYKLSYI